MAGDRERNIFTWRKKCIIRQTNFKGRNYNRRPQEEVTSAKKSLAEEQKEKFLSAAEGTEGLQMQLAEESAHSNHATTNTSDDNKAGQKAGSMIIKSSPTMFLHAVQEEKEQERDTRTKWKNCFNPFSNMNVSQLQT
eukprot:13390479-Ditylum_brightwellii.AAC.1